MASANSFSKTLVTSTPGHNTFGTYSSDTKGREVGRESRTFMDMHGINSAMGRGETDLDITYLELMNEAGTPVFIYPNAAGNGLIVSTTRP